MTTTDRREAGNAAEDAALRELQKRGLTLVTRNYRCRLGEIDLVMLERATLALIEVRFRRGDNFGGAAASVDFRKQKRVIAAAKHLFLTRAELRRYPARFDVVAVTPQAGELSVEWIRDAFRL